MPTGKPPKDRSSERTRSAAATMRRSMTDPERRLWRGLRDGVPIHGSRFRRQFTIGPYIADFRRLGARLVVEVDGEQHAFEANAAHDARRDDFLRSQGFRVLRFSNRSVMTELPIVLETIWAATDGDRIGGRGATPTPDPSPQGGGE